LAARSPTVPPRPRRPTQRPRTGTIPPPPARKPKPKKPPREKKFRPERHERQQPPPWAFFKGALLGFVFALPVAAIVVWLLAHLGFGDPTTYRRTLRFAIVFAGLPAVLSAGGAARVAARAAIAQPSGALRRAIRSGAITFAPAAAGLVLLTALPLGGPATWGRWLTLALIGLGGGLVVGGVIGLWAGGPIPPAPATATPVTPPPEKPPEPTPAETAASPEAPPAVD
jgi:hypothetical protein